MIVLAISEAIKPRSTERACLLPAGPYYDGLCVDGLVAETIVSSVQRNMERFYSTARSRMLQFDEVLDPLRLQGYAMRQAAVLGGAATRARLVHHYLQASTGF